MIMKCNVVYFSPTYTTKRIVIMIANDITEDTTYFDITEPNVDIEKLSFGRNDFVIIGIPVYSGRVPNLARNIIASMRGHETPIVLVATYGNRHYDDSLLELKNIVQSKGFLVVAAAAFVTEHSVVQKFGAGRPDDEDVKVIHKFAQVVKNKIDLWDKTKHNDLHIKGDPNYRKYQTIPIKPHTTSSCIKCGLCAKKCPVVAIDTVNPKKTDRSKCVTCMRCVRICPQKARKLYFFENIIAEKSLEKLCQGHKQAEIFI